MQAPQSSSLSCIPCAKRKVRCDRSKPCSHCRRRRGDICEYPLPIVSSRNFPSRVAHDNTQSQRVEKLEHYIRSLGGDPDQVAQSYNTGPTTSEENAIQNVPSATEKSIRSQNITRHQDEPLGIPPTGSRNGQQAGLVEHEEETTYIETFAPLLNNALADC